MPTKHGTEAGQEIKRLLTKVVGFQLPIITETPPQTMHPEKKRVTGEDLKTFEAEIDKSNDLGLIQIGFANNNVRTEKAYRAFEMAGIHPKEYSFLGYYHFYPNPTDEVTSVRYMLLW